MSQEIAVSLIGDATITIILVVAMLIVPGLVVGLLVSIFQAATQINEQTLSFLPKLIVSLGMVVFAGHWILQRLLLQFQYIFENIPNFIG